MGGKAVIIQQQSAKEKATKGLFLCFSRKPSGTGHENHYDAIVDMESIPFDPIITQATPATQASPVTQDIPATQAIPVTPADETTQATERTQAAEKTQSAETTQATETTPNHPHAKSKHQLPNLPSVPEFEENFEHFDEDLEPKLEPEEPQPEFEQEKVPEPKFEPKLEPEFESDFQIPNTPDSTTPEPSTHLLSQILPP